MLKCLPSYRASVHLKAAIPWTSCSKNAGVFRQPHVARQNRPVGLVGCCNFEGVSASGQSTKAANGRHIADRPDIGIEVVEDPDHIGGPASHAPDAAQMRRSLLVRHRRKLSIEMPGSLGLADSSQRANLVSG